MEILVAGSDTTSHTITMALHHILQNQHIKEKLTLVVTEAVKDAASMPSYTELDQVEYLVSTSERFSESQIPTKAARRGEGISPNNHARTRHAAPCCPRNDHAVHCRWKSRSTRAKILLLHLVNRFQPY